MNGVVVSDIHGLGLQTRTSCRTVYTEPRFTKDLDIRITVSLSNQKKVFAALAQFGALLTGCTAADFGPQIWCTRSEYRRFRSTSSPALPLLNCTSLARTRAPPFSGGTRHGSSGASICIGINRLRAVRVILIDGGSNLPLAARVQRILSRQVASRRRHPIEDNFNFSGLFRDNTAI